MGLVTLTFDLDLDLDLDPGHNFGLVLLLYLSKDLSKGKLILCVISSKGLARIREYSLTIDLETLFTILDLLYISYLLNDISKSQ